MADTIQSLQLDNLNLNNMIHFTNLSYFFDRGPRYNAYAQLRESKLRSKQFSFEQDEEQLDIPRSEITPPMKKSVRFQESLPTSVGKQRNENLPTSVEKQRKENQKPVENQVKKSSTPPLLKRDKMYGSGGKSVERSKSVNSVEKQSNSKVLMMSRKSCASIEELKGLSIAASNSINGENRGGKKCNVLRKSSVFSTRYY